MFNAIPRQILDRMEFLEKLDARDRADSTPRFQRLRQIPPETGKFLAISAVCSPDGDWIEIGTSAGYSTLWLALACRQIGKKITTFEILEEKIKLAEKSFAVTGVTDCVDLINGNALEHLANYKNVAFCFLDAEKDIYMDCYELIVPNMVSGGLLIADNIISHADELKPFLEHVQSDIRVDSVVVPIGKGELVCRKI
jgi:predicted O-methyltransferase YrrM